MMGMTADVIASLAVCVFIGLLYRKTLSRKEGPVYGNRDVARGAEQYQNEQSAIAQGAAQWGLEQHSNRLLAIRLEKEILEAQALLDRRRKELRRQRVDGP